MPDYVHTASRFAIAGVLAIAAMTAGCAREQKANRVLFDGHYFPTKTQAVDAKASLADFTVVISDASMSLDGAREAGRFAGTRYCIENYGSSEIDWKVGPDTEPQQLRIVDNELTFAGTCQRP